MDDQRVGSVIRSLRIRRGWRQTDLAGTAGLSTTSISRAERGHISRMTLDDLRRIGSPLDLRLDLVPRWRGGDLDRLLADRHARMHDAAVPMLRDRGWTSWPEVSFSVFGERGVIDLFAWHAVARTILVVELKTEIVDANELVATLDRKRRLALGIARDRGLAPARVGTILLVADSATNRRRVAGDEALLRSALPARGSVVRRWLRDPLSPLDGLLFVSNDRPGNAIQGLVARKRVRCSRHRRVVRGDVRRASQERLPHPRPMDNVPRANV